MIGPENFRLYAISYLATIWLVVLLFLLASSNSHSIKLLSLPGSNYQAIVESVASAKRIHFIDLAIRSGGHCTVLMQALATRYEQPIEMLKVTAVGSRTASRQKLEDTGKTLAQFAEALRLPFSFKIEMVIAFNNLNDDAFESDDEEATAVY